VQKLSRILALASRAAMGLLAAYFLANAAITLLHPQAPLMGSFEVERAPDGRVLSTSSLGAYRLFIRPALDSTLDLSGSKIPLSAMTPGSWAVYLAFSAAACAVAFKLLWHLHLLFRGFAHGRIFTAESIRQIRGAGHAVLLWGVAEMLRPLAAFWIYQQIELPSGIDTAVNINLPFGALAAGFIIWAVALAFEEGRKLQDETALTV
jgi:hypothetical protein